MKPRSSCGLNGLALLFVGVFLVVTAEGARATSESCGDVRFGHEFTSLELYGISPSEGSFMGNPTESGACGLSPFLGGDPAAAAGIAVVQLPTLPGDLFGTLEISTQEGSLEAVVVNMHQPRNPDPETGRPRITGATGPCRLPTGAADPYYPDPDCWRPGASDFGEQSNSGLNEGFTAQAALIDATQFAAPLDILKPDGTQEFPVCLGKPLPPPNPPGSITLPVPGNPPNCIMPSNLPGMAPANNTPYFSGGGGWRAEPEPFCYDGDCLCGAGLAWFLEDPEGFSDANSPEVSSEYSRAGGFEELVGAVFPEGYRAGDSYCVEFLPSLVNDVYLEDPGDPRNRYADPNDPLYQGEKFREGLPDCDGSLSWDACVAPLYVPQLDPNNTPANVGSEFAYREDAGYSATRGDAAGPTSRDFYESLCEASANLSVDNTLPLLQTELRILKIDIYQYFFYPPLPTEFCADRGRIDPERLALYDRLADSLCPQLPLRSVVCASEIGHDWGAFTETLDTCIDETWGAQLAEDWFDEAARMPLADADVCLLENLGVKRIGGLSAAIPGSPTPATVVLAKLAGGFPSIAALVAANIGSTLPQTQLWHDYSTVNTAGFGAYNLVGGSPGFVPSREMQYDAVAGCFDQNAANSAGKPNGRRCDWDDYPEFRAINTYGGFQANYNPRIAHETLNAVLAPEQEALLGCGAFFENNCDAAGASLFDSEASALLQSLPPSATAPSSWRTDGLPAGAKVMVRGGLSKVDICGVVDNPVDKPNGPKCEGANGVPSVDNPLVTHFRSAYQGLTLDQIQLLFQDFLPNCSTWLGRVNPGEDCVRRYAQPGTIGSRDIGLGFLQAAGVNVLGNGGAYTQFQANNLNNSTADFLDDGLDPSVFEPEAHFPNFEGDFAEPRCTTEHLGGAPEQTLPGCRNKWANYQGEMIKVTEIVNGIEYSSLRANLNLFGRDRYCQDNWVFLGTGGDFASPEIKSKCFTFSDGTPLAPGQFLGGVYSPRDDLRSWDATKDGDPDYLGFDNLRTLNKSGEDYLHPAVAFRTEVAAGTNPALPNPNGGNEQAPFWTGGNRCTPYQFLPLDQGGSNDTLRAQCSRFVRSADGTVDPNQLVLAKGTGHPLTGQAWANEMAGISWNLLTALVATSPEYAAHKILLPNWPSGFPTFSQQPLDFATFDPDDPENADRIAAIQANETQYCTSTASGYVCPPAIKQENNALRAEMVPICSFITPGYCSHVQAMLSYTAQTPSDSSPTPTRRWAWESGAEYRVATASGVFAGVETVYAKAPTTAPAEIDEDFQMNLLLVTSIPEPAPPLLVTTVLATLVALSRRKRSSRRGGR